MLAPSANVPSARDLASARDMGEQQARAQLGLMQLRDAHLQKLRGYEVARPRLELTRAQLEPRPALLPNFALRPAVHEAPRPVRPPTLEMIRPLRPQSARGLSPVGSPSSPPQKYARLSSPKNLSSPLTTRRAASNKFRAPVEKEDSAMSMSWESLKKNLHGSPVGSGKNAANGKRAQVTTLHTQAKAMGIDSSTLMLEAHDVFGAIDKDYSGYLDMHELDRVSAAPDYSIWLRRPIAFLNPLLMKRESPRLPPVPTHYRPTLRGFASRMSAGAQAVGEAGIPARPARLCGQAAL